MHLRAILRDVFHNFRQVYLGHRGISLRSWRIREQTIFAFTSSSPKQKHSRSKSRQLTRLSSDHRSLVSHIAFTLQTPRKHNSLCKVGLLPRHRIIA